MRRTTGRIGSSRNLLLLAGLLTIATWAASAPCAEAG